jgi:pyruvate dehydrogenase E2 component (dihydrolipoamide acetyltransferase)
MPKLGSIMQEATIIKWLKNEGDKVLKGEPLLEITTDKIVTEIIAPASGVLLKKVAEEGDVVPIKGIIGIIGDVDEKLDISIIDKKKKIKLDSEISLKEPFLIENNKEEVGLRKEEEISKIKASPAAKKIAQEEGINLADVPATGPMGQCTRQDVVSWIEKHKKVQISKEEKFKESERSVNIKIKRVIKLSGIKLVMARKMVKSISEKPHVTLIREVNVKSLLEFREKISKKKNEKSSISINVLMLKICAASLKNYPIFNAHVKNGEILEFVDVNLGIAVASKEGLLVPVIKKATTKTLKQLNNEFKNLVTKAKENNLEEEDLRDGTFTLTNLGSYKIEAFTPIINPPEVAILGIGKITDKPIVENNEIKIVPIMVLSLSFDHQAIDGATAAEFLDDICQFIIKPETLLL